MFSGLLSLNDFTDHTGRVRADSDLRPYLAEYIEANYESLAYGGYTHGENKKRVIDVFMDRYKNVEFDPNIGLLNFHRVVAELCPLCKRKPPSVTKKTNKDDVAVKTSSSWTGADITKLVDTVFGGASDSYKQYLKAQVAHQAAQNKPIYVPQPYVNPLGLQRDYTWLLVAGGVAALGLLFLTTRRGRRTTYAVPAHSGPTIDVTPTRYLPR